MVCVGILNFSWGQRIRRLGFAFKSVKAGFVSRDPNEILVEKPNMGRNEGARDVGFQRGDGAAPRARGGDLFLSGVLLS